MARSEALAVLAFAIIVIMSIQALAPDFAILDRVIASSQSRMSQDAARAILAFHFGRVDVLRMNTLAARARDGELSDAEMAELGAYERIGHLLSLLHARAKSALRQNDVAA